MNEIISKASKENRNLFEYESMQLLSKYNVNVPSYRFIKSRSEIYELPNDIRYPVVLKVVSKDILHKSDCGGVIVNIHSFNELIEAYDKMNNDFLKMSDNAEIKGFLISEQVPQGAEFIAGAIEDENLGKALMIGFGGIYVELFKDVVLEMYPISRNEALDMVKSLKSYKIIQGYRGHEPLDENKVADLLLTINQIIKDIPEINQIEINPFYLYENDLIAVDAKIILK